jgi:DNA-binding GntR family transcriptional regulator
MITKNTTGAPARGAGGRLLRKTAVELVEDELRAQIMSGALAPGTPLRQEALSEELGVSRIPLREAIRLLSFEGLVDLIPHKGAYVTMVSIGEVRELFELRMRLEPWLLKEACPLLSEADLDQAERIIGSMNDVDEQSWGQLNWEFHGLLYRAAQRPMAMNMVRSLHEKTERYLRFQVVNTPIRQQAHDEHLALITLCRNRQAESAAQALTQHIADAAHQIQAVVARLLDTTALAKTS